MAAMTVDEELLTDHRMAAAYATLTEQSLSSRDLLRYEPQSENRLYHRH